MMHKLYSIFIIPLLILYIFLSSSVSSISANGAIYLPAKNYLQIIDAPDNETFSIEVLYLYSQRAEGYRSYLCANPKHLEPVTVESYFYPVWGAHGGTTLWTGENTLITTCEGERKWSRDCYAYYSIDGIYQVSTINRIASTIIYTHYPSNPTQPLDSNTYMLRITDSVGRLTDIYPMVLANSINGSSGNPFHDLSENRHVSYITIDYQKLNFSSQYQEHNPNKITYSDEVFVAETSEEKEMYQQYLDILAEKKEEEKQTPHDDLSINQRLNETEHTQAISHDIISVPTPQLNNSRSVTAQFHLFSITKHLLINLFLCLVITICLEESVAFLLQFRHYFLIAFVNLVTQLFLQISLFLIWQFMDQWYNNYLILFLEIIVFVSEFFIYYIYIKKQGKKVNLQNIITFVIIANSISFLASSLVYQTSLYLADHI